MGENSAISALAPWKRAQEFQDATPKINWQRQDGAELNDDCVHLPESIMKIDHGKGRFNKFANGVGFSAGHYVIVWTFALQHQPHCLDVILGPAPISLALQISQREIDIETSRNSRHPARDLTRDEIFPAPRRFVIVENAVADKQTIGLPIHANQLRGECFGTAVRTGRLKGSIFSLRDFVCITEDFRARRVIKPNRLGLIARNLK